MHYRRKEAKACGYAVMYTYGATGEWTACDIPRRRESECVPAPSDRILTMKETAERLGCSAEIVAQLVRETTLWGTKMDDGGWGIKESELQRFIEAKQRPKEK